MVDAILNRYTGRVGGDPPDADGNTDNIEDLGGWGLLRGHRDRALSLELYKRDDAVLAIPYALIEALAYEPADGITIRAAGREIRIFGRNLIGLDSKLPSLFSALARQRVPWLRERSIRGGPSTNSATVIELIRW